VGSRSNKRVITSPAGESPSPPPKRAKQGSTVPREDSKGLQVPTDRLPPAAVSREAQDTSKAVKKDDAVIPIWLWNDRILARTGHDPNSKVFLQALTAICKMALSTWKRLVASSFWRWFILQPLHVKLHSNTLSRGLEAIRHANEASWWSWDKGSSPFFW
jgi:hypothetical protein